ncbi:MAG: sialidase family protein [Nitrospiraceae bacterium]|nr:sialidase family protein [Nitrospiraceae bacterium]
MKKHEVLAVVLFLVGCLAFTGAEAFSAAPAIGPVTLVSGPSPFAQGCDGGPSLGFLNYHNYEVEPYVAVNPVDPLTIVVSWQQDRWQWGGANGFAAAVTHDGGATWSRYAFPYLTVCSGGHSQRGGDPWLSFAPNGDLYHAGLMMDAYMVNSGVMISKSVDGGDTWSGPTTLDFRSTPNAIADKPSITADPADSRYVYAAWAQNQFGSGVQPSYGPRGSSAYKMTSWFSRTTDGGQTWEPARMIYDPGEHSYCLGHQIVVLPDGELLNVFHIQTDKKNAHGQRGLRLAIMRSADKGETWGGPAIVDTMEPVTIDDPTTGEMVFTGATLPDVAVDGGSGNVYLVWEDGRFSGGVRDGIAFSKSTDGGLTWSAAVKVNKASAAAFTPSVAVSADGTIAVTYYDLRNDTSDPLILQTDYWVVVSHDGGETWEEAHIAGPFDMRSAPEPGAPWYFVGDYVGLAAAGNSFITAFPMANFETPSNPTDIFVSTITP